MAFMQRPKEISEAEWEMLLSPENYYMDGEVTPAQADSLFRTRVQSIVFQRRAASRHPAQPALIRCRGRVAEGGVCSRTADSTGYCWQHKNSRMAQQFRR